MRNTESVKFNIHVFREMLHAFAATAILNFVAPSTEIFWHVKPHPNYSVGLAFVSFRGFEHFVNVLGFCDRASWANCEVREKTNKIQQLDVY